MSSERTPLDSETVTEIVGAACWPVRPGAPLLGRVGIEAEAFVVAVADDGSPRGRLSLAQVTAALAGLPGVEPAAGDGLGHPAGDGLPREPPAGPAGVPAFALPGGGLLTVEPGAQVEHATAPRSTAAAALADLDRWQGSVDAAFARRGASVAAAGIDVWQPAWSVHQQLTAPRYPAMAAFFDARGGSGHTMMCHTCALQVNLDLGPPGVAEERWLVANLAAPLVVGSFAASPTAAAVSGRGRAWLHTDPTRTGFPRGLVEGAGVDPVAATVDAAMTADVLLLRDPAGGTRPGVPGWSFGAWVHDGHPVHGRPTEADLRYHLTTLFPEVRVRGFFELRGVDALPRRWRAVPVALLTGLLYDDRARGEVRDVLERHRQGLPGLLRRAVYGGLADPALCALAVETWSFALAGAARLPTGFLPVAALRAAEAFLDRFTLRGRCPSDELRERLAVSPAAALAWATDPVGSPALA
jgi:glutamate--cysteine ligase